jgi:hypothetical protein
MAIQEETWRRGTSDVAPKPVFNGKNNVFCSNQPRFKRDCMNRSEYFNFIEDRLVHLATRIELRSKKNLLDLNIHSENFYSAFFKELFGWNLQNMNTIQQNAEAIDLKDDINRILIQVSSTSTKQKIDSALGKNLSAYKGYSFKFISISKDANDLRSKTYNIPHNITFSPVSDIYDVRSILDYALSLDLESQKRIYGFIRKELVFDLDLSKLDTNLASIIGILSKEDWDKSFQDYQINSYEISRKIDFNDLKLSKLIIDDFMIHHARVDRIYTEFNKLGVNKTSSVLSSIRKEYIIHSKSLSNDDLFLKIIEQVVDKIKRSSNLNPLPEDELELCASILVVDAFIRCKIFKNPEGYAYAAS